MFRFVKASAQDAEALARTQGAAFAESAAKCGSGPPGYDSPEWQLTAMQESIYYAIWNDQQIIGGILLSDQGEGHFYLHRLFVAPPFQKQGAASQALEFIEKTIPATRWTLHTPALSGNNRRFYEQRGYKHIGEMRVEDPSLIIEELILFHYEKRMGDSP
jgi:GNAT superfamily N-acetyltransferase